MFRFPSNLIFVLLRFCTFCLFIFETFVISEDANLKLSFYDSVLGQITQFDGLSMNFHKYALFDNFMV